MADVVPVKAIRTGADVTALGEMISTDTIAATRISNTPAGNLIATTVQAAINELDSEKQAALVSGTNIKTVNSTSLLGSGDVAVQATLVSGTNIKTINDASLLGSGNVAVQPLTNGLTDIGADLVDGDEIPVYDTSATANRKSALSRLWTYLSGKLTATANVFTANQTISVTDNTNPALKITQAGTGHCLVVEDVASDTTPFVIDAEGRVIRGHAAALTTQGYTPAIQSVGTSSSSVMSIGLFGYSSNTGRIPHLLFGRSLSDMVGTEVAPTSGQSLGRIAYGASDGTAQIPAVWITGEVDGDPGTNDMPGRLIFSTTADGGSSPTERMRINSAGNVLIATATDNSSGAKLQVNGAITAGDGSASLPAYSNSDDPNTGIYFPEADTVAIATGGTERIRVDSAGSVGIGGAANAACKIHVLGTLAASTNCLPVAVAGTIPNTTSGQAQIFRSAPSTQAAAWTLSALFHFTAFQNTIGVSSVITEQHGFSADSGLTGASTNFGFRSNLAAPTSGVTTSATISTISSSGTTATITTSSAHGYTNGQTVTIAATANATALVAGVPCTILTVGDTDFTLIGASANTVGTSFTATGAGTGTGTVTLNVQGSGKTVAGSSGSTFTVTGPSATHDAVTVLTGTVTVSTRWNFYAGGTARNYFAGGVEVVSGTTGMTAGFTHVPSAAGAPTGAPTNPSGNVPLYYDSTNNKLYAYNGAWRSVTLA